MNRRKALATLAQHQAASTHLLAARTSVHEAMRALGVAHWDGVSGQVLARETDALLRLQRAIDNTRIRVEERLAADHPGAWTTDVYFPREERDK